MLVKRVEYQFSECNNYQASLNKYIENIPGYSHISIIPKELI